MGTLPPVFVEFIGAVGGFKTATAGIRSELTKVEKSGGGNFAKLSTIGKGALIGIGGAALAVGGAAVKMAGDFQQQMTRVATGAGELQSNLAADSAGVLKMAGDVGQSTKDLAAGLYTVNSAGFHGAEGLTVLKNAAMGAKVGNADLATVTDAVTTSLNAYHMGAGQAAQVTNALVAAEGQGKTTMEDLAGSLATVLPVASTAKVGLNEVLGAISTMTAEGTPAADAATYLRQTIAQLENPSGKAAQEMKSLGLSSVEVAQNLGTKGLASTLTMLTDAIQKKMGPAGTVLIEHLQKAAKSSTDFQKVLANLPPAQQTYVGALATMVGGTKSMQAALELTGDNMKVFTANTQVINDKVKAGGNNIEGWAQVQKNFNQQVAEAKGKLEALGISIGNKLMPYAQQLLGWLMKSAEWLGKHKEVAKVLAVAIGGPLVVAIAAYTISMIQAAAATIAATWPILLIIAAVALVAVGIYELVKHWKTVWGEIKKIAEDVWHWLVHVWHAIAKDTEKFWKNDIVKPVMEAWHSIVDFFKSAWHAVADPIVAAWHWIEKTTKTVWDGISGFFKKWWPLLLMIFLPVIGIFIAIWNHFHKQITDTVEKVWNAIKSTLKTVWDWIKKAAEADWKLFQDFVIKPVEAVWHRIVEVWDIIMKALDAAWKQVTHAADAAWKAIKDTIIKPIEDAWHQLERIGDSIWHAISGAFDQAWHAVEHVGDRFADIGWNIVMGIIHGIGNAGGHLFDALGNLANDALKSAKSFLGISSPSKLFADQVGQWIPHGIAAGVARHGGVAMDAVTALTGRLGGGVPVLAMAGAGGAQYAGAAGVAAGGMLEATIQIDGQAFVRAVVPYVQRTNNNNSRNFFGQGVRA